MRLFDIQRFSVQDGPGIRTSVFMKGCTLRCQWCHNPESFQCDAQMMFFEDKCLQCGLCVSVCKTNANTLNHGRHSFNRDKCVMCGNCMDICPVRAFEKVGFDLDECELYDKILRDKKFYDATGGGVTFTGGEPMIQIEALQRIIRLCKQGGIHVAVETSSMVSWDSFQKIVDLVDLFICDLKAVTNELHMEGTGESNRQIRSNLIRLFACRADSTWIRIPLIPGFNDTESEFSKIVRFLSGYHFERVEIMPYHDIGISKYDALGMVYPLKKIQPPSQLHIDELKNRLINGGVYNVS